MRQDREPQFLETGALVVMRTAGFREARHRFFGRTALYETYAESVLEIDDRHDPERAEILVRQRKAENPLTKGQRGGSLDLPRNRAWRTKPYTSGTT